MYIFEEKKLLQLLLFQSLISAIKITCTLFIYSIPLYNMEQVTWDYLYHYLIILVARLQVSHIHVLVSAVLLHCCRDQPSVGYMFLHMLLLHNSGDTVLGS